jgi:ABC-2 type transport system permease protein
MIGFWTLLYKELLRFWKVAFQTVGAPVLTALLYLLIFGHVLDEHVQVHGVRYTSFLCPRSGDDAGFAECLCQFIVQSDPGEDYRLDRVCAAAADSLQRLFAAYVLAALARGLMVGIGVLAGNCLVC